MRTTKLNEERNWFTLICYSLNKSGLWRETGRIKAFIYGEKHSRLLFSSFFFVQKISNDSFLMFRNLPITNLSGQLPSVFSLWHCFSCDAKANAGRPWIGSECAFLFTNWLETYPRNCNTTHGALFPRDDSRFGAQTICLYRRASFAVALR